MTQFSINPLILPSHIERAKEIALNKKKKIIIDFQPRTKTTLKINNSFAADRDIKIGNKVLLFRETLVLKWKGLYLVANVREKILTSIA